MTTSQRDERVAAYLWDPSAPAAEDVVALERPLRSWRFDAEAQPLEWRAAAAPRSPRRRWVYGLAAAAAIVVLGGGAFAVWRLSWPAGRAWTIAPGKGTTTTSLAVGSPLDVTGPEGAEIAIARVGTLRVEGDARLVLRSTQGRRHRLALERGTVRVRTWAPPGTLVVITPVGEVIDLGCEFDLTAGPLLTSVRVHSGWVQLENGVDEQLIPEGALSEMRPGRAPGVPVYEDAAPGFLDNVRALEAGDGDRRAIASAIAAAARPRDVFTLLMLVERGAFGSDVLAQRAADLVPPPAGVTVGGILRGDRDGLWRWRDSLPLPSPKNWLRNWRDALPAWLVGRR